MSQTVESDEAADANKAAETDIGGRVDELIERGLSLYGGGDLEGAMSAWRHALALDDGNRRATDYVAYVKRHFEVVDELVLDQGNFAPADVELEIPFGLHTMGLQKDGDLDAYESFEVTGTPAEESSAISEFGEEIPTRVGAGSAVDLDEGWSLEGDESTSGGAPNPLFRTRTSRETDQQIGLDEEVVTAENASLAELTDPADLDEIDLPPPGALIDAPSESFLDPPVIEGNRAASEPKTESEPDPKSTFMGFPSPPKPAPTAPDSENLEDARATAEISPLELGEALKSLNLSLNRSPKDGGGADLELGSAGAMTPPTSGSRAESLSDVEFDFARGDSSAGEGTGETSAAPSSPAVDFESKPYASVALVGEDSPSVGDAMVSFREPGLVEVEPAGGELELQLAELENELKTGSREVEWTKHEASPTGSAPRAIQPIERPEPRKESTPRSKRKGHITGPPAAGLDRVQAAILAVVEQGVVASESSEERVRRRIAGFLACSESELERGELTSAAVAADMALEESPDSALGQKLIHERSDLLVSVFRKFLGDQAGVVAVALPFHELEKYQLDHRTAFLLSRVDGTLNIEDILDVSGMARLEAYRCLARLVLQGVLEVR